MLDITLQDILYAAILALFVTWIINSVSKMITMVVTRSTELGYRPSETEAVLRRCYSMFPIDSMRFNGALFQRGMHVQVTTNRNRVIEGEFIGINGDNMLCLITPNTIIAHELDNIEEMKSLT